MAEVEISKSHKGAVAEAVAVAWLLKQGFYVFTSATITGPADMVAWKPGEEPILIDVKSTGRSKTATKLGAFYVGTQKQKSIDRGIKFLYVNIERGLVSWSMNDFHAAAAVEDALGSPVSTMAP